MQHQYPLKARSFRNNMGPPDFKSTPSIDSESLCFQLALWKPRTTVTTLATISSVVPCAQQGPRFPTWGYHRVLVGKGFQELTVSHYYARFSLSNTSNKVLSFDINKCFYLHGSSRGGDQQSRAEQRLKNLRYRGLEAMNALLLWIIIIA